MGEVVKLIGALILIANVLALATYGAYGLFSDRTDHLVMDMGNVMSIVLALLVGNFIGRAIK